MIREGEVGIVEVANAMANVTNGVGAKGSVLNLRGARALGFADAHSSPREGESPKAEKPGREGGAGVPLQKPFRRMRPMGSQGGRRRGKGRHIVASLAALGRRFGRHGRPFRSPKGPPTGATKQGVAGCIRWPGWGPRFGGHLDPLVDP